MMRVLDLFSGIGGFSLGLESTQGFETVAFCEIDPFCRRVLAKHWPSVPCYEDVRELTGARLAADGIAIDVIAGGFPCQDLSAAGKRVGIQGERSGLWREYRRLIGELRPRFAIVENVPGLLGLGMGTILGQLSALGYDAVWDCIPASAIGAPHRRDRVWLVAHAIGGELRVVANTNGRRRKSERLAQHSKQPGAPRNFANGRGARRRRNGAQALSDANGARQPHDSGGNADTEGGLRSAYLSGSGRGGRHQWSAEPDVGRVAHGVPNRVDRLRSLGNAIVPQIAEMIGRAILSA